MKIIFSHYIQKSLKFKTLSQVSHEKNKKAKVTKLSISPPSPSASSTSSKHPQPRAALPVTPTAATRSSGRFPPPQIPRSDILPPASTLVSMQALPDLLPLFPSCCLIHILASDSISMIQFSVTPLDSLVDFIFYVI
ncbi:unnamed protein product [Vicia faba]|uniref:Uncharacterized protein n=1 Tax=Vicia faba TaxID=3906 RepID=A0AAV0ZSI1_VICFA|nr:unnamed protein product [Vicia faba]